MMHRKLVLQAQEKLSVKKSENFLKNPKLFLKNLKQISRTLNETGVETSDLETKLASYNLYIISAQEKKERADSIYDDENVTRENMEKANNYLRQSISDINKANKILREIFDELKEYETELTNVTRSRKQPENRF